MIRQKENQAFLPVFLMERSIRRALQNLYVAIVGSNDNARVLAETDLDNINVSLAGGNDLVKNCFISSYKWLVIAREFALSEKLFLEQILEPVRNAARFIIDIRGDFSYSSTTLKGIIFAKSDPYYSESFGDNRVTLSLIIPDIESVMSIRCSAVASNNIQYGAY